MKIGEAIIRGTERVTKDWKKYQVRQIRSYGRATWRPPRVKKDSIKDIAWRIMPEAYAKAAGGVGMCQPRQLYYAARPSILEELDGKEVNSVYFTQTLLPDYIAAHPSETASWDIIWDERGHFREPHTGKEIGLGTLAVRKYLTQSRSGADTTVGQLRTRYPTVGPRHRFASVLLIEKEGFQPIFEHVQLDTRYDLAIMSSKGMNTTAARTLVEKLPGVRFLVLHDFDKAGFSILGTLTRSTRRYHYHSRADVVDLGVRLKDVEGEDLPSEPVHYPGGSERNLRLNGARQDEIEFLVDGAQRVELNAFTSDRLIEWLERKLDEQGVKKIVPDDTTLAAAYRRAVLVEKINAQIVKAREAKIACHVPKTLGRRVRALLKADPELSWDEAVRQIVEKRRR